MKPTNEALKGSSPRRKFSAIHWPTADGAWSP